MGEEFYPRGARALQDRFDERRLADRVAHLVHDHIEEKDRGFIEGLDMFFLATVDEEGRPSCSYKGGAPGFVRAATSERWRSRATTATACSSRWATSRRRITSACCSSTSSARRGCA